MNNVIEFRRHAEARALGTRITIENGLEGVTVGSGARLVFGAPMPGYMLDVAEKLKASPRRRTATVTPGVTLGEY